MVCAGEVLSGLLVTILSTWLHLTNWDSKAVVIGHIWSVIDNRDNVVGLDKKELLAVDL